MTYTTQLYMPELVNPEHVLGVARQAVGIPPTVPTVRENHPWEPGVITIASAVGGYDATVKVSVSMPPRIEREHTEDCEVFDDCNCPPRFTWSVRLTLDTSYNYDGNPATLHEQVAKAVRSAICAQLREEVSY